MRLSSRWRFWIFILQLVHLLRLYLQGVTFEPKSQRDYCIKELVETERNYVEALNMIMTVSLSKQLLFFWDENLEIVVGSNLGDNPVAKKISQIMKLYRHFHIFRFSTLLDHYEQS